MTDVIANLNPFEKYQRMLGEKYLFPRVGLISRALSNEIASLVRSRQKMAKGKDDDRTILGLAFQDEEYGSQATLNELVDQMKTFLFAGHDTTASMLSWAYYYLSYHPHCHAKIKAEHDEVFGPDTDLATVGQKMNSTPSILGKLEYTLAVLKESQRLRPIGDGARYAPPGYIIRTATGAEFDTTGTILNVQHEGLQTREEIWGPTAAEFDPERFMLGNTIPYAYMPFATRPRDCIGRNLAYLEVSS
jgi:cytochrome P450